jgi:hypothetical protein
MGLYFFKFFVLLIMKCLNSKLDLVFKIVFDLESFSQKTKNSLILAALKSEKDILIFELTRIALIFTNLMF